MMRIHLSSLAQLSATAPVPARMALGDVMHKGRIRALAPQWLREQIPGLNESVSWDRRFSASTTRLVARYDDPTTT